MALSFGARAEGAVLEDVIDEVTARITRIGLAA
jgi:MoxR-like ATPase